VGIVSIIVEIRNPANQRIAERVECLLDSGMHYSVVPMPILERLGIKPIAEQEFRLPEGRSVIRKRGAALFKYGDRIGYADVIFGEPLDATILGELTLTALGLFLDPLRRDLKSLPLILASERAST
jgi:predicted aspartyl protease